MNGSFDQAAALVRTLPDVADCRIEADASGAILAVHVVPRTTPAPPHLAQDVALFLATETELRVAAERVRVESPAAEQVSENPLEELEYEGRVRLTSTQVTFSDERSWAEVELELGPNSARGHAEMHGAGAAPELVARACLEALVKLCGARVALRLVGVRRATVGSEEVVSVVVQECAGREERLHVGAARSDGDAGRAAAYAVLLSMNRRVGRILAAPPRLYRIG
jgi:hypothetical protein